MSILHEPGTPVKVEELKEDLLLLMDSIDSFCRDNGIQYYILGGTMLGAIRHKGFIPWDDDIDIGMIREDYERFCDSYVDNKNPDYGVVSIHNSNNYYLPFAKVIDKKISLRENIYKAPEIGAYIDVFPLDFVQRNSSGSCSFFDNKATRIIEDLKYIRLNNRLSFKTNIAILASRVLMPVSLNTIAKRKDTRAKKSSTNLKTGWIANLHGAWREKEIVPAECFFPAKEYDFEGRKYFGPSGYDKYLTSLYGDYMKLPPVEKRITHHNFCATWK